MDEVSRRSGEQTRAQRPLAGKYWVYLLVVKLSLASHPRVTRSMSSGEREQILGGCIDRNVILMELKQTKPIQPKSQQAKILLGKSCPHD